MSLLNFIYYGIALLVAITVHEAAHAWTAYKLGDHTAKYEGRVTLNPLAHLDPIGTLMIFVAHFGWGKPVPYNPYHLKDPKRDSALIAVAGPAANFLTALILTIPLKYFSIYAIPQAGPFLYGLLETVITLNIFLLVFNLLPIAPLDGSKLIGVLVPREYEEEYQAYLHIGPYILLTIIGLEIFLNFSIISSIIIPLYDYVRSFIILIT